MLATSDFFEAWATSRCLKHTELPLAQFPERGTSLPCSRVDVLRLKSRRAGMGARVDFLSSRSQSSIRDAADMTDAEDCAKHTFASWRVSPTSSPTVQAEILTVHTQIHTCLEKTTAPAPCSGRRAG